MMKKTDDEKWKPLNVKGFEDCYEASNKGRIRSVDRIDCAGRKRKGKILKPAKHKGGYLKVALSNNAKMNSYLVHRLIAMAWIPNPLNLPEVNHLDENPSNNRIENLEYCTSKYNSNYGNHIKNMINTKKEKGDILRPIVQISPKGKIVAEFKDIKSLMEYLKVEYSTILTCCRNNKHGSNIHKGLRYQYADDENIDLSPFNVDDKLWYGPIIAYNYKTKELIDVFDGIKNAADKLGVFVQNICYVLNGKIKQIKGYTFKKLKCVV